MRLMSYNLLRLTLDRAAAAEVVRGVDPDVLAVQEPPRGPWGRARLRRFARDSGLRVVLAGRGARTTALLAAPRVLPAREVEVLRLPWRGSRVVRRWWGRRGVVLARLAGVDVVVVHLALDATERLRHARLVLERLAQRAGPTVLLGDLNEPPSGPVVELLGEVLRDAAPDGAPTFPARGPVHRIDYALVSEGAVVRRLEVLDGPLVRRASDHLPVVVEVEARAPERPLSRGVTR